MTRRSPASEIRRAPRDYLVPTWNEIVQALEKTDQLALAAQIKHDYLLSAAISEEEGMLC